MVSESSNWIPLSTYPMSPEDAVHTTTHPVVSGALFRNRQYDQEQPELVGVHIRPPKDQRRSSDGTTNLEDQTIVDWLLVSDTGCQLANRSDQHRLRNRIKCSINIPKAFLQEKCNVTPSFRNKCTISSNAHCCNTSKSNRV